MGHRNEVVHELGENDFDDFLKKNRVVLVDFWAPWCMPCVIQGRMIRKRMKDLPEGAMIAKVNVDLNPRIADKFRVRGIPQLYLMVNGKPVKGWTGLTPVEVLFKEISRHISI